ncbi:hypothetical protein [Caballeronia sp. DA-9]|uniref:hypothetical protein n=1 Tax=Caballeronia sp. DA-9 TaxID=3436237 RepID=UPI003F66FE16
MTMRARLDPECSTADVLAVTDTSFARLLPCELVVAAFDIDIVYASFEDDFTAPRLDHVRGLLTRDDPWVALPLLVWNGNSQRAGRLLAGRHRTTVLWELGRRTLPVLTTRTMAEALIGTYGVNATGLLTEYHLEPCASALPLIHLRSK